MDKARCEMLYDRMINLYQRWAEMPRPAECGVDETLEHSSPYFERLAFFRRDEWNAYVSARDIYFREYKQHYWH